MLKQGSKYAYTIGYVPNAFAVVSQIFDQIYTFGLVIPCLFCFILRMFGNNLRYSRVGHDQQGRYDLRLLPDSEHILSPVMRDS